MIDLSRTQLGFRRQRALASQRHNFITGIVVAELE